MIELVELDNGFDVRVHDAQVGFVTIGVQLEIGIRDGDGKYLIVALSTPFEVRQDSGEEWITLDPELDDERLGVLAVRLRRASVKACRIGADGTLVVEFGPNITISVAPCDRYESWDIDHKMFKVVSGPGGELYIWDRKPREG
jgi:hypothetical protein